MKRIIFSNICLLFIFIVAPSFLIRIYLFARVNYAKKINSYVDARALLPIYKDKNYSKKVWENEAKIYKKNSYKSFIEYRHDPINTSTLKINLPYSTRASTNEGFNNSVWFFGGSTIFGSGVADKDTIPSLYSKFSSEKVLNLGEKGWFSRHSLNQFINLLGDGYLPKKVIFYSGVNDVINQCRTSVVNIPSSEQEKEITEYMKMNSFKKSLINIYDYIKWPYSLVIRKLKKDSVNEGLISQSHYDCHLNEYKAERIANQMMQSWITAYNLTQNYNIEFKAILQPLAYTSTSPKYYLNTESLNFKLMERQYNIVYPIIKQKMKKICIDGFIPCNLLVDGTSWTDIDEEVYIDFCHLSPLGNEIVSRKIYDLSKQ